MTRNIVPSIAAVILVGGKARRLNGVNKCNLVVGEKTCLEWTLDVFKGQVAEIALSVGPQDRFNHAKSHQVIKDWPSPSKNQAVAYAILGSINWAKNAGFDAIITAPVDTPFLPKTYAADLKDVYTDLNPVVFRTAKGLQGLHAIWPVSSLDKLNKVILDKGTLKISKIHTLLHSTEINSPNNTTDLFANINDDLSLEKARKYWASKHVHLFH